MSERRAQEDGGRRPTEHTGAPRPAMAILPDFVSDA